MGCPLFLFKAQVTPVSTLIYFIMRISILMLLLCSMFGSSKGQELYVFTNPASNNPAKSVAFKAATKVLREIHDGSLGARFSADAGFGLHKNLQLNTGFTFSNMYFTGMRWESARIYAKYRFLSNDAVHRHFRAAAYVKAAYSRNPLVYQDLDLEGDNSGLQTGLVFTQLLHKFAASAGIAYVHQLEQQDKISLGPPFSDKALQYNLSTGYLLFPRSYNSYNQPNFNLYCELLGQHNLDVRRYYVDIAPAIQLILKSTTRINAGARFQLAGNAHRMARESFFLSLEHYLLNALK